MPRGKRRRRLKRRHRDLVSAQIVDLDDGDALRALLWQTEQRGAVRGETVRAPPSPAAERETTNLPVDACLPEKEGCKTFTVLTPYADEPHVMITGSVTDIERLLGICSVEGRTCDLENTLHARLTSIKDRAALGSGTLLRYADVEVHPDTLMAKANGVDLWLTPAELRLLRLFVRYPKRVLTRDQLLSASSRGSSDASDRSVDAHIKNLRKKLNGRASSEVCIHTVYGIGYRLE